MECEPAPRYQVGGNLAASEIRQRFAGLGYNISITPARRRK